MFMQIPAVYCHLPDSLVIGCHFIRPPEKQVNNYPFIITIGEPLFIISGSQQNHLLTKETFGNMS